MAPPSRRASGTTLSGSLFEVSFQVSRASDEGPGIATPRVARGTRIAIKRVAPHLASDPLAHAALLREAAFLAVADHSAFPRVFDVDQDERGTFIVEEWVAGSSLDQLLEHHDGAIPTRDALAMARALTATMIEIHALSDDAGPLDVVHGDPSPSNVLWDGSARLVDFGASHVRGAPAPSTPSTGTLPYAAPELCRGEVEPSQVTDVYATAATVARLLIDRPLSDAPSEAARLMAIADHGIDLRLLTNLPLSIRSELQTLLAFRSTDRPPSLHPLLKALSASAPKR